MQYRFFSISARDPDTDQHDFNLFCNSHRILDVDKQFVDSGLNSYWSMCVTYIEGQQGPGKSVKKRQRIDYREHLSEQDFTRYLQLRALRKQLADHEGVPVYALFTNEQLASMVTRNVKTLSELEMIEGIGQSRMDNYAESFLAALNAIDSSE